MSVSQYCVSWDSYTNNIARGFFHLQQNEEFVDMTLAAEGHFVKVHQNIIALASPYLKQILQSAPCAHPIIFLSNISHDVLCYLLEYIYTGEIMISAEIAPMFIEACKALHITGVENFIIPKVSIKPKEPPVCEIPQKPNNPNYAAHITINAQNYQLEVNPLENNAITEDLTARTLENVDNEMNSESLNYSIIRNNISEINPIVINTEANEIGSQNLENVSSNTVRSNNRSIEEHKTILSELVPARPAVTSADTKVGVPQYAISNRGSVQLILNRYMYYCHHHASEGRKRRWRCIDYRRIHCPASIDMEDETITVKSAAHTHPYHDNKILKKFKQKSVFTSLSSAQTEIAQQKYSENLNEEDHDFNIAHKGAYPHKRPKLS